MPTLSATSLETLGSVSSLGATTEMLGVTASTDTPTTAAVTSVSAAGRKYKLFMIEAPHVTAGTDTQT